MKIAIERVKFQNALTIVKDVVSNSELQILNNVKIETTGDDEITLTATNLDQVVSTKVKCQIQEPGEMTVPAKVITPMVGALTSTIVEFKHDGGANTKAVLSGGDVVYKIATLPSKEFPKAAEVNGLKIVFSQNELKAMFRKTMYAASIDSTRRSLVAVCLQTEGGKVAAIATDGRRLACAKVAKDVPDGIEVIIPSVSVRYLQRLLGNEGDITVTLEKGKAAKFDTNEWTIQTKLVDDVYPDWKKVVPVEMAHKIPVERSVFADAVKQVSLSSTVDNTHINISLKDNVMTLTATSQDISDAKAMMQIQFNGDEIKTSFNPHYILDVLGSFDDDTISMNFNNGASPVTFTSESSDGVAVIMPLRVN